MKRLLFLIALLLVSFAIRAQISVKEGSFKEAGQFFTMKEDMTDDNYTPYAVIRVRGENMTPEQILQLGFQGDARTYIEVEPQENEVWVYLTYLATYLKITHPDLSSTEFTIPYDLEPLHGYELVLVSGAVANNEGRGALTVTTVPEGASLEINGVAMGSTPYHNDMMAAGTCEIKVSKDRFKTITKTIIVKNSDNQQVEIVLPPVLGTVEIKSEPSGAIVIVDGEKRGKTPLIINDLQVGEHGVRMEKENYFPVFEKIIIDESNNLTINETLQYGSMGAIKGKFTIDEKGTQVYFSKGNLQYQASTGTWRFAEHQWDYVGSKNRKVSANYDGWIDLFGWGTSGYKDNMPYHSSHYINGYCNESHINGTNFDWGVYNEISNGGNAPNVWRTLTWPEMRYILFSRKTASGVRYAYGKVHGVAGIIVLPDDWKTSYYKLNFVNDDVSYNSNIISNSDWQTIFEDNGAVFLPAAGIKWCDWKKVKIQNVGASGYYWLSTSNEDNMPMCVWFKNEYMCPIHEFRNYGQCVRLVRTAEPQN